MVNLYSIKYNTFKLIRYIFILEDTKFGTFFVPTLSRSVSTTIMYVSVLIYIDVIAVCGQVSATAVAIIVSLLTTGAVVSYPVVVACTLGLMVVLALEAKAKVA